MGGAGSWEEFDNNVYYSYVMRKGRRVVQDLGGGGGGRGGILCNIISLCI